MDPFAHRLAASAERVGNWLCVGLDPDPVLYPDGMGAEDTHEFMLGAIEATSDLACAYKPNSAFFEALGSDGMEALEQVIAAVPPETPVILDAKRNDIGNTARKYAEAAFDELGADAITVTPYLGRDTVAPFAEYADRGVIVLARTSNPSAGEFQDLDVGGEPFYEVVARRAMHDWQREFGNIGLVAGATYPNELHRLRALAGDGVPILIPGVGAQGGDAATSLANGCDTHGRFGLVNVGRSILYAGDGEDWKERMQAAARGFAEDLRPVDG